MSLFYMKIGIYYQECGEKQNDDQGSSTNADKLI